MGRKLLARKLRNRGGQMNDNNPPNNAKKPREFWISETWLLNDPDMKNYFLETIEPAAKFRNNAIQNYFKVIEHSALLEAQALVERLNEYIRTKIHETPLQDAIEKLEARISELEAEVIDADDTRDYWIARARKAEGSTSHDIALDQHPITALKLEKEKYQICIQQADKVKQNFDTMLSFSDDINSKNKKLEEEITRLQLENEELKLGKT